MDFEPNERRETENRICEKNLHRKITREYLYKPLDYYTLLEGNEKRK